MRTLRERARIRARSARFRALSTDANVDADMAIATARDATDGNAVAISRIDVRREPLRDLAPEVPELQTAVPDGERVRIVRVVGLAHELEGIAGSEPAEHALPPLETDADDLRIEIVRLTDRRKPIANEKRVLLLEELREKRRVARLARRRFGLRRNWLRFSFRSRPHVGGNGFVLGVEIQQKPLESGFRCRRGREPVGSSRAWTSRTVRRVRLRRHRPSSSESLRARA